MSVTSTTASGTAAVNNVKLAVRDWGDGQPPLLLLHGYMGSGLDWVDVAPLLADGRRVVAYDHRGHGQSSHPTGVDAYTFEALARDLGAFIEMSEQGPVDLLGHSMGGVVALMYALRHPERVRSLVLMDTAAAPAGNVPMEVLGPLIAIGREQGMGAVAQVVAEFAVNMPGVKSQSPDVIRERAIAKFSAMDIEALEAFAAELGRYPSMVDRLKEIACPVTVIVGENDEGLRAAADVFAERIVDADLVVIPGAGHSPQEDRPEAWVAAVLQHLARAANTEAGQ